MRADRDVQGSGRARQRANAESAFKALGEDPDGENADDEKTIHQTLATDRDLEFHMGAIKKADDAYKTAKAAAKEKTDAAKATLDEAYATAVDALVSRRITKTLLKEQLAIELRDEEQNRADFQGKLWMLRARGLPVGKQIFMFDEEVRDEEAVLAKADRIGYDDAKLGRNADSAYPASSTVGQSYLRGYNRGSADNLSGQAN